MPLAVGHAPADENGGLLGGERSELLREPRLADPGRPEDREHVQRAVATHLLERVSKLVNLGLRGRRAAPSRSRPPAVRARGQQSLQASPPRSRPARPWRVPRTSRSVSSSRRISPGAAASSSSPAAVIGSPTTEIPSASEPPARTSPVERPTPIAGSGSIPSRIPASRISSAADTDRNASSSCTFGTPKTAITEFPRLLVIVPP